MANPERRNWRLVKAGPARLRIDWRRPERIRPLAPGRAALARAEAPASLPAPDLAAGVVGRQAIRTPDFSPTGLPGVDRAKRELADARRRVALDLRQAEAGREGLERRLAEIKRRLGVGLDPAAFAGPDILAQAPAAVRRAVEAFQAGAEAALAAEEYSTTRHLGRHLGRSV